MSKEMEETACANHAFLSSLHCCNVSMMDHINACLLNIVACGLLSVCLVKMLQLFKRNICPLGYKLHTDKPVDAEKKCNFVHK